MSHDEGMWIRFTFIVLIGVFSLLLIFMTVMSIPYKTKAASNTITLQMKVQGTYKELDQITAKVVFYTGPSPLFEEPAVTLVNKGGIFTGDLVLKSDFKYEDRYALFIKPDKGVGRLFCNDQLTGPSCTTPSYFFLSSGSTLDLTSYLFYLGDVTPANGKVDAQDMSLIMKNLGKTDTASLTTDLNRDGITDVVDYSLAFYSLSENVKDDEVKLVAPNTPTSTPTPIPTSPITPTESVTPTVAPSPTSAPSPTVAPSPTSAPSPTVAPSPTTAAGGTCHGVPIIGEPFDVPNGITPCECEGNDCYITNCTCPSGVCTCNISSASGANCSNGGKIAFTKCTK